MTTSPVTAPEDRPRVVVLGAGPGGYAAAFHAADLGMEVTLVDDAPQPGGVCLYRGCIPSKALLHVAGLIHESRAATEWGVSFGEPKLDLPKLREWKQGVVDKLTRGLGQIARGRRVTYMQGRGYFEGPNRLRVRSDGEISEVEFDYAIVATGSLSAIPQVLRLDSPRVMDSEAALELEEVPETLLIVGGGYIGLELGTVYSALGSQVTVVEMTNGLLPGADRDLVEPLQRRLKREFRDIFLNTRVSALEEVEGAIRATFMGEGEPDNHDFGRVLIAVGRTPNTQRLGLENTQVRLNERGFIRVDGARRTDEPSIFAIGDVTGEPMLAHKATHEGRVAAEAIAGMPVAFEPAAIPAVVFTDPEVAWCGLTEAQALDRGIDVAVSRFPWAASGRATTMGTREGVTKLVIEPSTERVLGIGVTGHGAGELMGEAVMAIEMGVRVSDLHLAVHAHPTLAETLMEAASLYFGHSPHYLGRQTRG
ncbi:MAG: dihydrolipoyl dehydrogenase [Dehalococcoidia bacterium]